MQKGCANTSVLQAKINIVLETAGRALNSDI